MQLLTGPERSPVAWGPGQPLSLAGPLVLFASSVEDGVL